MEVPDATLHTRFMARRSLTLRVLGRLTLAAVAVTTLVATPVSAEDLASNAPPATTAESADLRAVALDFEATNDLERWLGGSVDGVLTLTITNAGTTAATGVVASAQVGDRVTLFPPVDLAPGATTRVATDLSLGGMSFRERDVVATIGETRLAVAHRTVPWILLALIGAGVNVALVAGRDQLRAAVRRRVEAAGPLTAGP